MSGAKRLLVSGIALTALLVVVAIASRAHKPGSGSGATTGHVPRTLLEYFASVMIVLIPIAAILIVWAMAHSRREAVLSGQRKFRRWIPFLLVIMPLIVFGAFRHFHVPLHRHTVSIPKIPTTLPQTTHKAGAHHTQPLPQAHFQWLPVFVLASLVLASAATVAYATYWRRRHGDAWDEEAAFIAALDEVLADTLDDLRAERDPRRAVIRTYARMEKLFAAYGVPRQESEAPLEYVARVLDRLQVSIYSVRRVTQLFARAKFSPHEIDAGMKDDAIEALAGLRAELVHEEQAA